VFWFCRVILTLKLILLRLAAKKRIAALAFEVMPKITLQHSIKLSQFALQCVPKSPDCGILTKVALQKKRKSINYQ
jgi:hypothetical protein